MTLDEATAAVHEIRKAAAEMDDEKAHGLEDELREAVLTAIARGCPYPATLATIALGTSNIKFSRWCA